MIDYWETSFLRIFIRTFHYNFGDVLFPVFFVRFLPFLAVLRWKVLWSIVSSQSRCAIWKCVKVTQMCIISVVAISILQCDFLLMRRELPSQPLETNRKCVRWEVCKCACVDEWNCVAVWVNADVVMFLMYWFIPELMMMRLLDVSWLGLFRWFIKFIMMMISFIMFSKSKVIGPSEARDYHDDD